MIRNAHNVMDLVIDEAGRAKKAQVGVDLTLNRVSRIGSKDNTVYIDDGSHSYLWKDAGTIISDTTSKDVGRLATYSEVVPQTMDMFSNKVFILVPGVYSIEFEQGLKPLPANQTAMIISRSTVGRSGALIRSSIYDPGFTTPKMGALMYVFTPIQIEQYARVAQIVIMENEEAELYNGSYQGEKDKR
jgi:deoxycytidine triphosphate deaminase